MTPQQKYIVDKLTDTKLTMKDLSKMTDINTTRVWRIMNTESEMKLNEYFALINVLRVKQLLTVETSFFLAGVE